MGDLLASVWHITRGVLLILILIVSEIVTGLAIGISVIKLSNIIPYPWLSACLILFGMSATVVVCVGILVMWIKHCAIIK
jgi:hypothetical protein